jgi:hypothetical protein
VLWQRYDNDAQVFCAITGGKVSMDTTPATCTLAANAGTCSVDAFFEQGASCAAKK